MVYLVGLHDVHRTHGGLLQDTLILQQRPHRLFHPAHRTCDHQAKDEEEETEQGRKF